MTKRIDGLCVCKHCNYGAASDTYYPETGETAHSCPACGHAWGLKARTDWLRVRREGLKEGERFLKVDATGKIALRPWKSGGVGVVAAAFDGPAGRAWQVVPLKTIPSAQEVLAFRSKLAYLLANPIGALELAYDDCYMTRCSGGKLKALVGQVPPAGVAPPPPPPPEGTQVVVSTSPHLTPEDLLAIIGRVSPSLMVD